MCKSVVPQGPSQARKPNGIDRDSFSALVDVLSTTMMWY